MSIFYTINDIPAHSALLLRTREEALTCDKGNIELGFCRKCGFISNVAFNPALHTYSSDYEGNQAFSAVFNKFQRNLAIHLIRRYDLHDKDIMEIGCGNGDFLTLLCELGGNRGIGFDPAYVKGRSRSKVSDQIIFIKDFYTEKHAKRQADFICCKMTLEHIRHTADFLKTASRSLHEHPNSIVFFQVPNVNRILREIAFWDIYYEHCSYFSLASLSALFWKGGFEIIDLWKDYDNQYLMIAARIGSGKTMSSLAQRNNLEKIDYYVACFAENYQQRLDTWKQKLMEMKNRGLRTVIWGAGSKGVAFLTTLCIQDEIQYVVDINPHKRGTYMAGTGQEIVMPDFLMAYEPDAVIVMNPIYAGEIMKELKKSRLDPKLIMASS